MVTKALPRVSGARMVNESRHQNKCCLRPEALGRMGLSRIVHPMKNDSRLVISEVSLLFCVCGQGEHKVTNVL